MEGNHKKTSPTEKNYCGHWKSLTRIMEAAAIFPRNIRYMSNKFKCADRIRGQSPYALVYPGLHIKE